MTGLLCCRDRGRGIVGGADEEAGGGSERGFGGVWHLVPLFEFVAEGELGFGAGDGIGHDAANASEGVGVADGNTILRDGGIEAAHGVVDVSGGHESPEMVCASSEPKRSVSMN